MTTGQRIAQKRKELGLSQEALGDRLGVTRQSIYKWESDSALPEIEKLVALSRLFGVSVGWLLGVEEPAPAAVGKSVPDGNPAGNEHSGAMGSGKPPADGPQELTPAQLQMVEAIVERYTAALPKPLSRQKRRLAKAGITLGVLCLLGGLLGVSSRLDELDLRQESIFQNISRVESSVDRQIGSISSQVESILKAQNSLVADYGAEILSADLANNTVTFSVRAVPKTYTDGLTVSFLADTGTEPTHSVPGTQSPDGTYTATLTCPLTDSITLSAVLIPPDGTRSTQLLDQFSNLYSASLPAVELLGYSSGELLDLGTDANGTLTLPELYITANPGASVYAVNQAIGCSDIAEIRVGLFQNKTLLTWLEGCAQPDHFHGDYGDAAFFHLPQGQTVTMTDPSDTLCAAAVITDTYGREVVYSDIPYVLRDGVLTWPDVSDISDHDPANWKY